jgi:hypothetical protein
MESYDSSKKKKKKRNGITLHLDLSAIICLGMFDM